MIDYARAEFSQGKKHTSLETKKLIQKVNWHHAAIQACFWAGFNAIWSYITVLLLYRGFDNTQIGLISATALLLPLVLSPRLAALADKNPRFTARRIAFFLAAAMEVIVLILWCFGRFRSVNAVCFMLIGVFLTMLPPYFNVMVSDFILRGINVNYGMGRGIGSIGYAVLALILGNVLEHRSPTLVVPIYLVIGLLLLVSIGTFRYPLPPLALERTTHKPLSNGAMLKKYPAFALLALGCALLCGGHSAVSTYLIHVCHQVGQGEALMGTLLAVSAAMELPSMILFDRLVEKKPLTFWFSLSAVFYLLRQLLMTFAVSPAFLYLAAVFQFFENGMLVTATTMYVVRYLDAANQAKGQSLLYVFSNGVGAAAMTILCGRLVDAAGTKVMMLAVSGCMLIGVVIVLLALHLPKKKERFT